MIASATVVITTRNRRDDLARAIRSALRQQPAVPVIVVDDASTDGSPDMVRRQFPQITLLCHDAPTGYIVSRNQAARIATTELIVSIDDDAEFPSPDTVAQTVAEFDDPVIAGVAIPYIDVNRSDRVIPAVPPTPTPADWYVCHTFTGTAHALRRDRFLEVGGYREALFHQGEERDLALRLLDRGYVFRVGKADPIHHHESPQRDTTRMSWFGRRNDVLFVWQNVPSPWVIGEMLAVIVGGLRYGWRTHRLGLMAGGLAAGLCRLPVTPRRPVRRATYAYYRQLVRSLVTRPPMPSAAW